jgi:hypothetical protein
MSTGGETVAPDEDLDAAAARMSEHEVRRLAVVEDGHLIGILSHGNLVQATRALAADPADPERWYVSAASGPGTAHAGATARGRLDRWDGVLQPLALPTESMPYALAAVDGGLVVGTADGSLLHGRGDGDGWTAIGERVGSILAMAVV